jgi:hypothetical protein
MNVHLTGVVAVRYSRRTCNILVALQNVVWGALKAVSYPSSDIRTERTTLRRQVVTDRSERRAAIEVLSSSSPPFIGKEIVSPQQYGHGTSTVSQCCTGQGSRCWRVADHSNKRTRTRYTIIRFEGNTHAAVQFVVVARASAFDRVVGRVLVQSPDTAAAGCAVEDRKSRVLTPVGNGSSAVVVCCKRPASLLGARQHGGSGIHPRLRLDHVNNGQQELQRRHKSIQTERRIVIAVSKFRQPLVHTL